MVEEKCRSLAWPLIMCTPPWSNVTGSDRPEAHYIGGEAR